MSDETVNCNLESPAETLPTETTQVNAPEATPADQAIGALATPERRSRMGKPSEAEVSGTEVAEEPAAVVDTPRWTSPL